MHANSQVALAYSLTQLREWLACGGMALGALEHFHIFTNIASPSCADGGRAAAWRWVRLHIMTNTGSGGCLGASALAAGSTHACS